MTFTLPAIFDGTTLRFTEPLDLKPNTAVRVTIQTDEPVEEYHFLAACLASNIEGPADWSENLEEYLYGDQQPSYRRSVS